MDDRFAPIVAVNRNVDCRGSMADILKSWLLRQIDGRLMLPRYGFRARFCWSTIHLMTCSPSVSTTVQLVSDCTPPSSSLCSFHRHLIWNSIRSKHLHQIKQKLTALAPISYGATTRRRSCLLLLQGSYGITKVELASVQAPS